jgi:hypothetical protein
MAEQDGFWRRRVEEDMREKELLGARPFGMTVFNGAMYALSTGDSFFLHSIC